MIDKPFVVKLHYDGVPVSEIASTLNMTEFEVKREIFRYWKLQGC